MLILSGKQLDILKSIVPEGQIMNAYLLEVAIDWKWLIVSHREEPLRNCGVSRISFGLGHLRRSELWIYKESCSFLCSWSFSITQPHTSPLMPDSSQMTLLWSQLPTFLSLLSQEQLCWRHSLANSLLLNILSMRRTRKKHSSLAYTIEELWWKKGHKEIGFSWDSISLCWWKPAIPPPHPFQCGF